MNSQEQLIAVLEEKGRLSPEQIDRASLMANETGQGLGFVMTKLGLLSEQALVDLYTEITGSSVVASSEYPDDPLTIDGVATKYLRRVHAIPLSKSESDLVIAMADPLDGSAIKALSFASGLNIIPRPALLSEIESAFAKLFPEITSAEKPSATADTDDVMRLKDVVSDAPVIRYVDRLIAEAVDMHASDIHLEPAQTGINIRFRIDGVLHRQPSPNPAWGSAITSRLKLMAGLNIAERRLPQDGRIRLAVRGLEIDLRVATTPTIHGESITLRILDQDQLALDFKELGFEDAILDQYMKILSKPSGMVLVTGPTGSGKTTTLYASLQHLNSPGLKIITVEDPIEYLLDGVNQVQIKPSIGLTFASALRSFLRLDPDILLVGEIRDLETAEIAIQASLTGHRVLSTLHTNDAATGITRLLDMGVAEYLISSTVTAILAQRLVRKLCPECRKKTWASNEVIQQYELHKHTAEKRIAIWQAVGCDKCNHTGYQGRSVILELLPVTETIRSLILSQAGSDEILRAAQKEGMNTMFECGIAKVLDGQTSIDEVLRVVGNS